MQDDSWQIVGLLTLHHQEPVAALPDRQPAVVEADDRPAERGLEQREAVARLDMRTCSGTKEMINPV